MREATRLFLVVAAVAFLLRVPFLDAGYGWDSDAWRVAAAAAAMVETGTYAAPRLPGNPVHDVAMALLWSLGPAARTPLVLNGASALLVSLGAGAFALAWRRVGAPDARLAGLAAASVPAVFIASVSTMDYAWGFAFVALAVACAVHGRAVPAIVFAALALGTRLTSAVALPAVTALLLAREGRWPTAREIAAGAALVVAGLVVGLLPYVPLWLERGAGALTWYDHGYPSPALVAKKATVDLWGWPGFLAWIVAAAASLARMARRGPRPAVATAGATVTAPVDPRTAIAAGTSAVAFAAWLRLPYKAVYLVPVVPFVLLAHAHAVPRHALRGLLVALCLSPWILSVSAREAGPTTVARTAREVRAFGQAFVVDARGPILLDHEVRKADLAYGARVAAAARRLPSGSALVVQDWLPMLRLSTGVVHGPLEKDGVLYTHLLEGAEVERLRAEGRTLYYLPGVEIANQARFGVDLAAAGARPLALEDGAPSPGDPR